MLVSRLMTFFFIKKKTFKKNQTLSGIHIRTDVCKCDQKTTKGGVCKKKNLKKNYRSLIDDRIYVGQKTQLT